MNVVVRKSFARDLRKLKNRKVLDSVDDAVRAVCAAARLSDLSSVEAMTDYPGCFRLRIGTYRLGLFVDGDRVELVRCLHRREIYRDFP